MPTVPIFFREPEYACDIAVPRSRIGLTPCLRSASNIPTKNAVAAKCSHRKRKRRARFGAAYLLLRLPDLPMTNDE
jgi:hypothetical protein